MVPEDARTTEEIKRPASGGSRFLKAGLEKSPESKS
jgi:hypothetical protein